MNEYHFISVILPLKLEWEPCYKSPDPVEIGERVRVTFARKEYVGVVSQTDMQPDIAPSKILQIIQVEKELEKIRAEEIELWRQVSQYYLCTIGEVYKAAYPHSKTSLEESRGANIRKTAESLR